VALFNRALALDPDNVDALVGIASTRAYQVMNLFETAERERLLDEAETLISRAIPLAPDHIGVLRARAVVLRARGRFEEAVVAARSVIALNPGEPTAYHELALNRLYQGSTQEAADWFRRADCVAPNDRIRWTWLQGLGRALLQLERDAEAVDALRLAVHGNPDDARLRAYLAAAEMLVGNVACAKRNLAKCAELDPGITIARFVEARSSVPLAAISPIYRRENERILDSLRRAGVPER